MAEELKEHLWELQRRVSAVEAALRRSGIAVESTAVLQQPQPIEAKPIAAPMPAASPAATEIHHAPIPTTVTPSHGGLFASVGKTQTDERSLENRLGSQIFNRVGIPCAADWHGLVFEICN
jgi:hypothetical protein